MSAKDTIVTIEFIKKQIATEFSWLIFFAFMFINYIKQNHLIFNIIQNFDFHL